MYLSLLFEASSLQMLIEGAQHLVGSRPQLGVIAAQGGDSHPEGIAGHKLQAVNYRL